MYCMLGRCVWYLQQTVNLGAIHSLEYYCTYYYIASIFFVLSYIMDQLKKNAIPKTIMSDSCTTVMHASACHRSRTNPCCAELFYRLVVYRLNKNKSDVWQGYLLIKPSIYINHINLFQNSAHGHALHECILSPHTPDIGGV